MNSFDTQTNDIGVVFKKSTNNYLVIMDGRTISCSSPHRLEKQGTGPSRRDIHRKAKSRITAPEPVDTITVGDLVRIVDTGPGAGRITEVLPRRNQLSRRSPVPMPTAHAGEQIIAANVDQVVPVFAAAQPTPKWNMLDRYLVTAETAGIPALICITKLDLSATLPPDDELFSAVEEYRLIGYRVILVSAINGEGIDELRQALQNQVSVFLGKSGVGKTSLLNALQPGLGQRTNAVNQITGKGKHTTTYQEMFPLESGGAIVDTPGVREFGLWDVGVDDLAWSYREIRPYIGQCRFGLDCAHDEEPGCAVRKAVLAGRISPRRYQSYLRLNLEILHERVF